jgi:hypothetical protein
MAIGAGGKTVLFGGSARGPGSTQRQGVLDDTWLWNGHSWSPAHVKTSPAGRMSASMGDDIGPEGLGDTVLFGGIGLRSTFADTWSWNGSDWLLLRPASPASARSAAADAFDAENEQFVVYGGLSEDNKVFDDTQVLTTQVPKRLHTSPLTTPPKGAPTTRESSPAHGTRPTSTTPLAATSASVHRGDVITLTGSGFVPGTEITITFHSAPVLVSRMHANKQGAFTDNVTVPYSASGGDHHFEATGLGPKGRVQLVTPVEVIGVSVGHAVKRWIKLTLVAIALAIPLASWFVLGAVGRNRRASRA